MNLFKKKVSVTDTQIYEAALAEAEAREGKLRTQ